MQQIVYIFSLDLPLFHGFFVRIVAKNIDLQQPVTYTLIRFLAKEGI